MTDTMKTANGMHVSSEQWQLMELAERSAAEEREAVARREAQIQEEAIEARAGRRYRNTEIKIDGNGQTTKHTNLNNPDRPWGQAKGTMVAPDVKQLRPTIGSVEMDYDQANQMLERGYITPEAYKDGLEKAYQVYEGPNFKLRALPATHPLAQHLSEKKK